MGIETNIEWTNSSWSPWWGCTKVSPGCTHCYADRMDKRTGGRHWGPGRPRRLLSANHWKQPEKWHAAAVKAGVRQRVFPSMCDPFDVEAPAGVRHRFFDLIERTPMLDWLLVTKRTEHVLEFVPPRWRAGLPGNVWLGASVENQTAADQRVPELLRVPARVRFLSCEPLIAPVNLRDLPWDGADRFDALTGAIYARALDGSLLIRRATAPSLDWVIAGGESGPFARPMHPGWARSLLRQCADAKVPFFFKQWGEWMPTERVVGICRAEDAGTVTEWPRRSGADPFIVAIPAGANGGSGEAELLERVGRERAGSVIDGSTWKQFPSPHP